MNIFCLILAITFGKQSVSYIEFDMKTMKKTDVVGSTVMSVKYDNDITSNIPSTWWIRGRNIRSASTFRVSVNFINESLFRGCSGSLHNSYNIQYYSSKTIYSPTVCWYNGGTQNLQISKGGLWIYIYLEKNWFVDVNDEIIINVSFIELPPISSNNTGNANKCLLIYFVFMLNACGIN